MKKRVFFGIVFICSFFSFFVNTKIVDASTTVSTPTFISVENVNSSSVKLNFKSNNSCSNCGIEILNVSTGLFYRLSNGATSYNVTGLISGNTYEFKISAYYIESGIYYNSAWSSSKFITVSNSSSSSGSSGSSSSSSSSSSSGSSSISTTKLAKPTFNSVLRAEYNAVNLSYKTSGTVTGVEILNTTTGKSKKTTNKTSYKWSDSLTYGKTYSFKIRSYYKNSSGSYSYSDWTSSKSRTVKIPTPTFSSVTVSDYNNITFKYKIYGSKVSGIQIYNVTTKKYSKTTNKTKYIIGNYSFGKKYTFKIRTYYKTSSGKYYYSYWTNTKSVTTKSLRNKTFNGTVYKYYQYNYSQSYCGASIRMQGCGPTAMAITASSLLKRKITPPVVAKYGCSVGAYKRSGGSSHALFDKTIKKYKLKGEWVTKSNSDEVLKALSDGNAIVVAHMGRGHFTSGGHYITLVGIKGNQVKVQDPASPSRSKYWSFSTIKKEAKTTSYKTPFLIVRK